MVSWDGVSRDHVLRAIKEYDAAPMPGLLLATLLRSASRQVNVWRFER